MKAEKSLRWLAGEKSWTVYTDLLKSLGITGINSLHSVQGSRWLAALHICRGAHVVSPL